MAVVTINDIQFNSVPNKKFGTKIGNKLTQWEKTIIYPINRFLEVMDIPKVNASNTHQLTLF